MKLHFTSWFVISAHLLRQGAAQNPPPCQTGPPVASWWLIQLLPTLGKGIQYASLLFFFPYTKQKGYLLVSLFQISGWEAPVHAAQPLQMAQNPSAPRSSENEGCQLDNRLLAIQPLLNKAESLGMFRWKSGLSRFHGTPEDVGAVFVHLCFEALALPMPSGGQPPEGRFPGCPAIICFQR